MRKFLRKNKTQLKSLLVTLVLCAAVTLVCTDTVFASDINQADVDAFMKPFNTLKYMFTTLISLLGTIYTLWCIGEWGMAWHESQGNVSGQSFKRMFGGIVMIMAPQLLSILT